MRSEEDLQRAHDILAAVMLDEVRITFNDAWTEKAMHAALDTLCWALGHDHNTAFARSMAKLEREIMRAGYSLEHRG